MTHLPRLAAACAAALMLAAAAPPPLALALADRAAIQTMINRLYAPYRAATPPQGDADPRLYSVRTRALIAQWKAKRPADELTDLADADWLCQCQDWDSRAFRAVPGAMRATAPGRAEVELTTRLAANAQQRLRLILVREGGQWRVDDLHFNADPRNALRARLGAELARFR